MHGFAQRSATVEGRRFAILAVMLAIVMAVVPYLVLAEAASFAAGYLFWCVVTLAVIVWAAWHTRGWRGK